MIGWTLRRLAIASILIFGFAGAACAEAKLFPLDKMFPFLQGYLQLPSTDRTRFVLNYRLVGDSAGLQTVRMALVEKGGATPIALGTEGKLSPLPTLQQFRDKAQVSIDGSWR